MGRILGEDEWMLAESGSLRDVTELREEGRGDQFDLFARVEELGVEGIKAAAAAAWACTATADLFLEVSLQ